jgi:hypothetical protein
VDPRVLLGNRSGPHLDSYAIVAVRHELTVHPGFS